MEALSQAARRRHFYARSHCLYCLVFLFIGLAALPVVVLDDALTALFTDVRVEQEAIYTVALYLCLTGLGAAALIFHLGRDRRHGERRQRPGEAAHNRRTSDRRQSA